MPGPTLTHKSQTEDRDSNLFLGSCQSGCGLLFAFLVSIAFLELGLERLLAFVHVDLDAVNHTYG